MPGHVWIDEHDIELDIVRGIGVVSLEHWSTGLSFKNDLAQLTDRSIMSPEIYVEPKKPRIVLNIKANTILERRSIQRALLDHCNPYVLHEVRFSDAPDLILETRILEEELVAVNAGNELRQSRARLTLALEAPDPIFRGRFATSVEFDANVRKAVECGNFWSAGTVYIMGTSTNPTTLIYRDVGGTIRGELSFAVALGSTEYLKVELLSRKVLKYTAGVPGTLAAGAALVSGTWFVTNPLHGSPTNAMYPTLETNATGGGIYVHELRYR